MEMVALQVVDVKRKAILLVRTTLVEKDIHNWILTDSCGYN
jgi:hypothetical protein